MVEYRVGVAALKQSNNEVHESAVGCIWCVLLKSNVLACVMWL